MKSYKKYYIELELPEWLETEEIRDIIQDNLLVIIKQTELENGEFNWHIAEID
jgi:hypothetical protein